MNPPGACPRAGPRCKICAAVAGHHPDALHLSVRGGTAGLFLAKVKGIDKSDQHECIAHWQASAPASPLWATHITYSWCHRVPENLCFTWYLLLAQKGECSQMYKEIRVPEVVRLCRPLMSQLGSCPCRP